MHYINIGYRILDFTRRKHVKLACENNIHFVYFGTSKILYHDLFLYKEKYYLVRTEYPKIVKS